jgi:alpha-L-fucosidase 2
VPRAERICSDGPGAYPNLFCAHPRFQIDGNFGGAAALLEIRLWRRDGALTLLPALPGEWPRGQAKGPCARGGFVLDFAWRDYRLRSARLHSLRGNRCQVRPADRMITLDTLAGESYDLSVLLCGEVPR